MQTALRLPSFVPAVRVAWLIVALAVIVALIALAIAAGSGHKIPPPFGPARTGLIAFDASGDIVVANADGTGRHAITSGPSIDISPVWSLDGQHLAFFSKASSTATKQSIVVVDAAGANPWVISTPATYTFSTLSWSPDGHRLAYIDNVQPTQPGWADAGDLAIADLTTRTTKTITHGPLASDPAWAPDGTRIAFKVSDFDLGTSQLDLIPAEGGSLSSLTDITSDNAGFGAPQWSPDGKHLLVWAGQGSHTVYVVDPSTGAATDLTPAHSADAFWATWSNDGTRIAYETFPDPPGPIDVVHVMNADGSANRILANVNVTGSDLFWSPDDRDLLGFDADGTSSSNAIVIPLDGSPVVAIPAPSNSLGGSFQRLAP